MSGQTTDEEKDIQEIQEAKYVPVEVYGKNVRYISAPGGAGHKWVKKEKDPPVK